MALTALTTGQHMASRQASAAVPSSLQEHSQLDSFHPAPQRWDFLSSLCRQTRQKTSHSSSDSEALESTAQRNHGTTTVPDLHSPLVVLCLPAPQDSLSLHLRADLLLDLPRGRCLVRQHTQLFAAASDVALMTDPISFLYSLR